MRWPGAGDKMLSIVDPGARRGKRGEFYEGYLLDGMIDADSQWVTSLDVLPANADEAAGERVRCPAGEVSGRGSRREDKPNTVFYVFTRNQRAGCPLSSSCCPKSNPEGHSGRRVSTNEELQNLASFWGGSTR